MAQNTKPCVYVLKSLKDGNKYIGSTKDINIRIKEHFAGQVQSTKYRRPLILLGYQEFEKLVEARIWERKYKNSHGALERAIKNGKFILI